MEIRKLILFPAAEQVFEIYTGPISFWFDPESNFAKKIVRGRQPISIAVADTENENYGCGLINLNPEEKDYSLNDLLGLDSNLLRTEYSEKGYLSFMTYSNDFDFSLENITGTLLDGHDYVQYCISEPNILLFRFQEDGYYCETILFFEGFDSSKLKFKRETHCSIIDKITDDERSDEKRIKSYKDYLKTFNYRKK